MISIRPGMACRGLARHGVARLGGLWLGRGGRAGTSLSAWLFIGWRTLTPENTPASAKPGC